MMFKNRVVLKIELLLCMCMILESTIKKNMANTDKSGSLMLLVEKSFVGVSNDVKIYNKAAIFATLKLGTIGENTSKLSEAKYKQAIKYCKFSIVFL